MFAGATLTYDSIQYTQPKLQGLLFKMLVDPAYVSYTSQCITFSSTNYLSQSLVNPITDSIDNDALSTLTLTGTDIYFTSGSLTATEFSTVPIRWSCPSDTTINEPVYSTYYYDLGCTTTACTNHQIPSFTISNTSTACSNP